MDDTLSLEELSKQRDHIKAELANVGDMRPGSLIPRFRKCGKPTCHCAKEGSPGHGPNWALTWKVDGKTVARIIPEGPAVEQTKEQILEFRRFQELSRELIEVNEKLCDAKLKNTKAGVEAAKKGASKIASKRKSPTNSPPS